jgi:hypothetical protein
MYPKPGLSSFGATLLMAVAVGGYPPGRGGGSIFPDLLLGHQVHSQTGPQDLQQVELRYGAGLLRIL